MPNLEVVVSQTAEHDMQEIFDFIAKDNVAKAYEMLDIFEKKFETLAIFPKLGYRRSCFLKRDVRECIVAKHYQIIYYVTKDYLHIQRILSGYEDYFHN